MTALEIYDQLEPLTRRRISEYETALEELAVARQSDYPGVPLDSVTLILADTFLARAGESISPDVQALALECSALQYLTDAFKSHLEARGGGAQQD